MLIKFPQHPESNQTPFYSSTSRRCLIEKVCLIMRGSKSLATVSLHLVPTREGCNKNLCWTFPQPPSRPKLQTTLTHGQNLTFSFPKGKFCEHEGTMAPIPRLLAIKIKLQGKNNKLLWAKKALSCGSIKICSTICTCWYKMLNKVSRLDGAFSWEWM